MGRGLGGWLPPAGVLLPFPESAVLVLQGGAELGAPGRGLLEEEGDTLLAAQVTDGARPGVGHGPAVGARFAADDGPGVAAEIDVGDGSDERLEADEERLGLAGAQIVQAMGGALIFNAGAHPDIGGPGAGPRCGAPGALGQNLKSMPGQVVHYLENPGDIIVGDELVEEVRHGIDEDARRVFDFVGIAQLGGFEHDVFGSVGLGPGLFSPAALETEGLGVAIAAALADFGAAVYRVPGDVGPTDSGFVHRVFSLKNGAPRRLAALLSRQHPLSRWGAYNKKSARWGIAA